jgi:murein DD-endopeptidase MepM/ murein hydrolase activator NlpD
MASFTIDITSPFPSGFTKGISGPNEGGHIPPEWYIQFGMDLGADAGTEVHAAFDAHVTVWHPHVRSQDTEKVYGAQLFMRSPNDMMGGFYTHITDVPAAVGMVGADIKRGDLLGKVYSIPGGPSAHLHLALVEIIGGAPNGRYMGVNLYKLFLDMANTNVPRSVTFNQDGKPPTPAAPAAPAPSP